MATTDNSFSAQHTSSISGVLSALGMILFFLIMRLLGLHHVFWLRFFNLFFLLAAIIYTIKLAKKDDNELSYLEGLLRGMKTTVINLAVFVIFFFFYMEYFDQSFIDYVIQNAPMGKYLNIWLVLGELFGEGFASGAMISFILMQYYKSDKSETI